MHSVAFGIAPTSDGGNRENRKGASGARGRTPGDFGASGARVAETRACDESSLQVPDGCRAESDDSPSTIWGSPGRWLEEDGRVRRIRNGSAEAEDSYGIRRPWFWAM
jgi:hypothetical protein